MSRKFLRSQVTSVVNKIDEQLSASTFDTKELEVLESQLQNKLQRLEDANKAELEAMAEMDISPAELEDKIFSDLEKSEEYNDKATRALRKISIKLRELNRPASPHSSNVPSSSSVNNSGFIKAPEFKLRIYDGMDYLKFPGWMDHFKSTIHKSKTLSAVDKFGYLKDSLSGQALHQIDSLLLNEENYDLALDTLEQVYGDSSLLLCLFVAKLHRHAPIRDSKSQEFSELVTGFEQAHQQILNLIPKLQQSSSSSSEASSSTSGSSSQGTGRGQDLVSYFLTPHLLSKIPEALQMHWFGRETDPTQRYSFSALISYLKEVIKSRRTCMMLADKSIGTSRDFKEKKPSSHAHHRAATSAFQASTVTENCVLCEEKHSINHCPQFRQSSCQDRRSLVSKHRLCFNCLSRMHIASGCRSRHSCSSCGSKHHTLLCKGKNPASEKTSQVNLANSHQRVTASAASALDEAVIESVSTPELDESIVSSNSSSNNVFMLVVKMRLQNDQNGKSKEIYAFFDSGATQSWISSDVSESLQLPVECERQFKVKTFDRISRINSKRVVCSVSDTEKTGRRLIFKPWQTNSFNNSVKQWKGHLPQNLQDLLANDVYDGTSKQIDVIIGLDYYHQFMTDEIIRGKTTATKTVFGWTVSGTAFEDEDVPIERSEFFAVSNQEPEKLWELDAVGIAESTEETATYADPILQNGRYQVELPFKNDRRPKTNFSQAIKRMDNLYRRLSNEQCVEYQQSIKDLLQKGILEPVSNPDPNKGFFLPHHGVSRRGKKIRIVFDGSSTDSDGLSLNDALDPGPNLLLLIQDVLLRFRLFEFTTTADIEAAFHSLSLSEDDRQWAQMIWRPSKEKPAQILRFSRLPFGLSSSPFLMIKTLQFHYNQLEPQLRDTLLRSTYVDDVVSSHPSSQEAQEFLRKAQESLRTVGMNLKKTDPKSVLGTPWNSQEDTITVAFENLQNPSKLTQRTVLKSLASLFDPLGLITPFTIRGRMIFQKTWKAGMQWDDTLSRELADEWISWVEDVPTEFKIPRWSGFQPGDKAELHIFADASSQAYASVVYLVLPEKKESILLMSKARVMPLKNPLTIPKAELMAVTIA
ncbi:hypothetical protein SNEBB_003526, partial [Seison nebaliae]